MNNAPRTTHPATSRWHPDDIDWAAFDPGRVDPDVAYVVRTVSLVEHRADLYSTYLATLFTDPDARRQIRAWGKEEAQHGEALGRWVALADPSFDFAALDAEYREAVTYHAMDGDSVRGSLRAELVARCVVEAMASAYYAAVHDAARDPALKEVADRLRRDEAKHFTMFRRLLIRERAKGTGSLAGDMLTVIKRVLEIEDDQIIYAAYCANRSSRAERYDRDATRANYMPRIYGLHRFEHVLYMLKMISHALDVRAPRALLSVASGVAVGYLRVKAARLRAQAWCARALRSRGARSRAARGVIPAGR